MWDWLKNALDFSGSGNESDEEAKRLMKAFLDSLPNDITRAMDFQPVQEDVAAPILTAPDEVQVAAAVRLFVECSRVANTWTPPHLYREKLMQALLRRSLPFSAQHIDVMLDAAVASAKPHVPIPLGHLFVRCGDFKAAGQLTEGHREKLSQLSKKLRGKKSRYAEGRKACARIEKILSLGEPDARPRLDRDDSWAALAEDDLATMEEGVQDAWRAVLAHALTATSAQPAARWIEAAKPLVAALGEEKFTHTIGRWFGDVKPRMADGTVSVKHLIGETNSDALKGLVWCCIGVGDRTAAVVADLAAVCYRKVPDRGPVSSKVGNACLVALERMGDHAAVAQLSRLGRKIKYVVAQRLVQRALQGAAEKAGISVGELEEITLPTFGLNVETGLDVPLGSFTAEIRITPQAEIEMKWRSAEGKAQQSVPAEVKSAAGEEWKELKRSLEEMGKLLAAQRDRIEGLFRVQRTWRMADWRERYLEHPLVAPYARRLIWRFALPDGGTHLGIWREGAIVGVDDAPLPDLEAATVSLWHPLTSDIATVQAWREWLVAHAVTQPTKQAHREIYVLTDAERQTETYSNRFAAHILRQHQFAALAHQRGWKYRLQGAFDSANTPQIYLPEWNLYVEFWVDPAGFEDLSDSGIGLYVGTDQVRFQQGGEVLRLADVPALIFSEMMRDVDLFVGVASVGNDPAWADRGAAGGHDAAWNRFALGELSQTGKTRREVLERLVPKLKIAAQCSFEDRFLVVRGKLRSYKIHFGSANILMEPNDQYLCIVPARGKGQGDKVFLPFEGDATLSIILSKAFLLAEDDKITDLSIVRQIKP